jgi:hypothetical protein
MTRVERQHFEVGRKMKIAGTDLTISFVSSQKADGIWHKEDSLTIWFDLDKPIGGVSGTAVELPVKSYTKDELIMVLEDALRERFQELVIQDEEGRKIMKAAAEKQEVLNNWAERTAGLLKDQEGSGDAG